MTKLKTSLILKDIQALLLASATSTPVQAKKFFKTSPGSYSEKDEFIGVTVPVLRKIAKDFKNLTTDVLQALLCSKFNEERLFALLILVTQYQKAENAIKEDIYKFYLRNLKYVNNWNLVDSSAHLIIGAHLWDKDRSILEVLAKSDNLWERRISIVSTWYFIRLRDFETTFRIAEILLMDSHDLIHKSVGWMLREAGKRDESCLLAFLHKHSARMPGTMLRYATERLSSEQIQYYKRSRTLLLTDQ